ncbi:hypothetical protein SEVIR_1G015350v4 [Setaria viridis]
MSSSRGRKSMDRQHVGVKDLVQRLTGRSPTAASAPAPAAPHRPRACRAGEGRTGAAAGAGPQGCHYYQQPAGGVRPAAVVASCAPPCQEKLLLSMDDDFSDLFYAGAIDQRRHGLNGGYTDFPLLIETYGHGQNSEDWLCQKNYDVQTSLCGAIQFIYSFLVYSVYICTLVPLFRVQYSFANQSLEAKDSVSSEELKFRV